MKSWPYGWMVNKCPGQTYQLPQSGFSICYKSKPLMISCMWSHASYDMCAQLIGVKCQLVMQTCSGGRGFRLRYFTYPVIAYMPAMCLPARPGSVCFSNCFDRHIFKEIVKIMTHDSSGNQELDGKSQKVHVLGQMTAPSAPCFHVNKTHRALYCYILLFT